MLNCNFKEFIFDTDNTVFYLKKLNFDTEKLNLNFKKLSFNSEKLNMYFRKLNLTFKVLNFNFKNMNLNFKKFKLNFNITLLIISRFIPYYTTPKITGEGRSQSFPLALVNHGAFFYGGPFSSIPQKILFVIPSEISCLVVPCDGTLDAIPFCWTSW